MRDGRSEIGVEWCGVLAGGMLFQEADRAVGEARAGVGAIGGGIALFLTIVEDACLERLQSLGERVASFAHVPSAIAGRRQHAGQEGLRVVRAGAG